MHTPARVAGVLILAATALAGCASATTGAASTGAGTPPITPAPATAAATSAEPPPTASHPAPTDGATRDVTLPWPVSGAAKVAALQSAVDSGAQPWLLDPTEVALSYAAARGWTDAQAAAIGSSGVTVRSSAGTHALTLAQPGRTGTGGIWVVTSDSSR